MANGFIIPYKEVNFIEHMAADAPSTYSEGIELGEANSSTDFPTKYACIITIKIASNYGVQFCIAAASFKYRTIQNASTWTEWKNVNIS